MGVGCGFGEDVPASTGFYALVVSVWCLVSELMVVLCLFVMVLV